MFICMTTTPTVICSTQEHQIAMPLIEQKEQAQSCEAGTMLAACLDFSCNILHQACAHCSASLPDNYPHSFFDR